MSPLAALAIAVFPQVFLPSPEAARRAFEAGERLAGRLAPSTAAAAAAQIRPGLSDEREVTTWAAIARAGGAEAVLGPILARAIVAGGPGTGAALRCLAALPPGARAAALASAVERVEGARSRVDRLTFTLKPYVTADDEEAAGAALTLLIPEADPRWVLDLLDLWGEDPDRRARAEHLLREVGRQARGGAMLAALAQAELPSGLQDALEAALMELIRSGAADAALELTRLGVTGAGGALLGALRALPPQAWEEAAPLLVRALETESGAALGRALRAAAELRQVEALSLAEELARSPERAGPIARAAAVEALGLLSYRDAPTVDLLIELLEDPDLGVRAAAYGALLRKSGARLPARPAQWRTWRRQVDLPQGSPQGPDVRLERERQFLKMAAQRELERLAAR